MKKKIVTIGGGSGQPDLLRYLKEYDVDITAIVTMMDNGGSSGQLREERGVLPPGDLRKCMAALAEDNELLEKEWNARDEDGHAVGNLALVDQLEKSGSWSDTIEYFSTFYHLKGQVLPVTEESTQLVATLSNGAVIRGEENIDIPQHDSTLTIKSITVDPPVKATQAVLNALVAADCIVFTMGDLYTSVIPNVLVDGVVNAIAQSNAQKVYVCNRTSKQGETHGFTSRTYVETLNQYLSPARLTHVIVDNETIPARTHELSVAYEQMDDIDITVIRADLGNEEEPKYVSGKKAAKAIIQLCTSL